MTTLQTAFLLSIIMGLVIFFCRVFPFLFFNKQNKQSEQEEKSKESHFLHFVEKTAPPVAMTILAFNAIASPIKNSIDLSMPVLIASVITALIYIWKHNTLLSIFTGTAIYMVMLKFDIFLVVLNFLNSS